MISSVIIYGSGGDDVYTEYHLLLIGVIVIFILTLIIVLSWLSDREHKKIQNKLKNMNLTSEQIEDIVSESNPKCPVCKSKLKCYFHERDSTSNYAQCTNKKCNWYASTDWNGNWS